MLKKQTVWLLTMLSLMIVLSAYYIFSPPSPDEIAFQPEDGEENGEEDGEENIDDEIESGALNEDASGDAEVTDISNRGQDELFTMMRMEVQNERSMSKERLNNIVKSSSSTTEEKNDALDNIETIDKISTKETILQEKVLSRTDKYEDVFVRHDSDKVHVQVRVNELSKKEANNIMQLVRNEFGEIPVEVNFDPPESE